MAVNIMPPMNFRGVDGNGNPLAGGKLYTYQSGTTTPQATYTDATGVTPNANPVILDSDGNADVWLDISLSYKFVLKDANDVLIKETDGVDGIISAGAVGTASLQDGSVTTPKIANDAVDSTKLKDSASVDAERAVTTNHLRDAAVTRDKLAVGATGRLSSTSVSADYTALITDDIILVDATSAQRTVTLYAAAAYGGRILRIKKVDSSSNFVVVDGNSTETIDGGLTYSLLSQNESITIMSDGVGWQIISAVKISALYTGYHTAGGATWSRTNTAFGSFTASGTAVLTQRERRGFAAVSTASSNDCGIAVTFPRAGKYEVEAFIVAAFAGTSNNRATFQLYDGANSLGETATNVANTMPILVSGTYTATAGASVTFNIRGKSTSSTISIGDTGPVANIEWKIREIV